MAHEIKVKEVIFADDSFYKTQRVRIGSKNFQTPIKALDLKRNVTGIKIPDNIKGINENYRTFDSKRIANLKTTNREQEINNEIANGFRKFGSADEVNICFAEFEENKIPDKDELEYLTNLSYVHSDITPLPLLPRVVRNITLSNFEQYHKFVKDAIKTIDESNNKPIMGVIPMPMPSAFLPQLLNTYLDDGITALCLDFQGSTVTSSKTKIRELVKLITRKNALGKFFTYSLNLGEGKLPKDKEVVAARDILSFGYGFDAMGGKHIKPRLPKEIWARIMSSKNITENSLRLFNKQNYGYYRATKKETVDKLYPRDSNVPLNLLEAVKKNMNIDKVFNQEQQGLETVNLRTVIKEQHKLLKYLDKKEYVEKNDIRTLEKVKAAK